MTRPLFVLLFLALPACAQDAEPLAPPPPCDQICQDGVAVRALRETMKLAYNLTLQGKPVGPQQGATPCPLGGFVRIAGTAASNAVQGATEVKLTYVLEGCAYAFKDETPNETYDVVISGTVSQEGILAVQPSATSALVMRAESVSIKGNVYAPPVDYAATCPIQLGQSGSNLTGTICGRRASADL